MYFRLGCMNHEIFFGSALAKCRYDYDTYSVDGCLVVAPSLISLMLVFVIARGHITCLCSATKKAT